MSENNVVVEKTEAISGDKHLNDLVSAASQTLRDLVGTLGNKVNADWSVRKDPQGRALVHLDLSDFAGRVGDDFTPEELENAREAHYRLNWLWGDLLQERSHKLLQNLIGSRSSEGDSNGP